MATTTFDNLITFSRGSNATVTGPNGLIQWAPSNLLTNSQDFEASAWTKGAGATVVANNQAAPDGTTTADTITFTAGGAAEFVRGFTTMVVGLVYTVSVYARRVSGTPNFIFDIGNSAAVSGTQTLTTDWQRFTFTFTFSGANQWVDLEATAAGSIAFWGAQLELGSTATTYNNTSVRNLLGFSEAFDNAAWTKTGASIVTGAQANPVNNLFNAQKLMENTANSTHGFSATTTAGAASAPSVFSLYAKASERSKIRVLSTDNATGGVEVIFDLAAGTAGSAIVSGNYSGGSGIITAIGGGWYRCAVVATKNASGNTSIVPIVQLYTTTQTYTGDGNSGVYIYGAMLSNSASLDPYVPTPGAAPSSTAYYGPRFDYDPVTLLPRGLLVEEQRTNLLLYSEQFGIGAGSWPTASVSITSNTTTAPDGTLTADTMTATSTGQFRYVNQVLTLTNGVTYTLTVYLKYKTARYVWLLGETNVDAFAIFDLLTGTVGSVSAGVTRSITAVGNGWYRCSATFTVSSATAPNQVGFGLSDTDTVITPPATAGIDTFIWGAQLEAGAFATSYIPTIASTVTRSADVATITGSLFSQWYGQARGTFVMNFTPDGGLTSGSTRVLSVSSGGVSNRVVDVNFFAGNWTNYNGTATLAIGPAAVTTIPQCIAAAYATANYGYTLNGGTVATDTSALVNSPTQLNLGYLDTGNYLNGHIRSIRYVPVRAADFQLQALTELPLVPTLDADFINNLYEA